MGVDYTNYLVYGHYITGDFDLDDYLEACNVSDDMYDDLHDKLSCFSDGEFGFLEDHMAGNYMFIAYIIDHWNAIYDESEPISVDETTLMEAEAKFKEGMKKYNVLGNCTPEMRKVLEDCPPKLYFFTHIS